MKVAFAILTITLMSQAGMTKSFDCRSEKSGSFEAMEFVIAFEEAAPDEVCGEITFMENSQQTAKATLHYMQNGSEEIAEKVKQNVAKLKEQAAIKISKLTDSSEDKLLQEELTRFISIRERFADAIENGHFIQDKSAPDARMQFLINEDKNAFVMIYNIWGSMLGSEMIELSCSSIREEDHELL